MEKDLTSIDLSLWLDQELIQKQNQLKSAFLSLLEGISDGIPNGELIQIHPLSRGKKISKGNDLIGFPYQVLDLIRDFAPESCCNIRLLNWFGHGFFLMLMMRKHLEIDPTHLLKSGFAFSTTESPWDYPELIIGQAHSIDLEKYSTLPYGFRLWIKPIRLEQSLAANQKLILDQVKNLLEILKPNSESKRI